MQVHSSGVTWTSSCGLPSFLLARGLHIGQIDVDRSIDGHSTRLSAERIGLASIYDAFSGIPSRKEVHAMKRSIVGVLALAALVSFGCRRRSKDEGTELVVETATGQNLTSRAESARSPDECVPDKGRSDEEPQAHSSGRRGRGMGFGARRGMRADMTTLHAMFADRDKINRIVRILPNGAEAVTESDDERIAGLIQEHVPAMEGRVVENDPLPPMTFHPIFVELIKHADEYELSYEDTEKGVKVTYSSDDPYVVVLVQEHAKLVSRFIENGRPEIHKPYKLPALTEENEPDTTSDAAGSNASGDSR